MDKKKLLFLAHYYTPDTASTGQLLQDLAEGMIDKFDITVICVVPSYTGKIDDEYKHDKFYFENINGVNVIRVLVPEFDKRSKKSRIKNIVTYFFRAIVASKKAGRQDYVFAISQPPVLGGILGVIIKKIRHAHMIYCIQDFNPEQVMAVNYSKNKLIIKLMMLLDKYSCRKSDVVITVGCDLVESLKRRFRYKNVPKFEMINNWIDEKQVYPIEGSNKKIEEFKSKYNLTDKYIIMYSGNIGLYYDLENIIKIIGHFDNGTKAVDGREVVFAFVGDGSQLLYLKEFVEKNRMNNITFIPYQSKEDLVYSLNAADVHWCVNAKGIKGVSCPSKAYGIMGAGKPIIGVLEQGTEIRKLIEHTECGRCCEPGDYDEIENIIRWYVSSATNEEIKCMGMRGRLYLEKNLTKQVAIEKYVNTILGI